MFYDIFYPLRDLWFGFNVFRYITFRASMAAVTSFIICVIMAPAVIRVLQKMKAGQYVRKEHVEGLYDLHKHKEGTPTMGGLLLIMAVVASTVMWGRLNNDYVILSLAGMVWLGTIGFIDDLLKIKNKSAKGIRALNKILGQLFLAVIVGLFVFKGKGLGGDLYLPFMKNAVCNLGIFYVLFSFLVIAGTSNALNLTDGLDGLATGCMVFVALTFAAVSYLTGHAEISRYLQIFYLPGAGELTIFCAALAGASLGFLWFNSHPATVFMGDTGSLALGGAIAIVSILIKKEILLLITGGVLVAEAGSVILQVLSFKIRGKRLFLMSPLHHHFQIKGWHEAKVTMRFLIVAAILALVSIATLKVR
ncbi:MAG: phospho-N-acetylmuramoyl-pentapeptide-transferase [Candidatus Omnitrophica bacterium]|nr:phospho-N-acetylmuramoyl-pentapeptide-transferase [Candidatus Omnitrophota bacterium]